MSQEPSNKPRTASKLTWILVAVLAAIVALAIVALGVGVYFTSQPGFFARYSQLQRSSTALESSAHKGMRCVQCHGYGVGPVVAQAQLIGDFYASLVGKPSQPVFFKFAPPKREACLQCHLYDWSDDAKRTAKVPHPAHLRVSSEPRDCVICHKWTAHEETYQAKHMTMRFSTVCASFECHVGVKPANDCKNCHHVLQESLGAWKDTHPQTVRANGPNGCLNATCHSADQCRECHTTGKTPVFANTISSPGVKAIEQQHVLADWISKHGAMALADPAKCLLCHVSEGECQDCHSRRPAFHGAQATWLGQHQPIAKANPTRCMTCHQQSFCDDCHKQFKENR